MSVPQAKSLSKWDRAIACDSRVEPVTSKIQQNYCSHNSYSIHSDRSPTVSMFRDMRVIRFPFIIFEIGSSLRIYKSRGTCGIIILCRHTTGHAVHRCSVPFLSCLARRPCARRPQVKCTPRRVLFYFRNGSRSFYPSVVGIRCLS